MERFCGCPSLFIQQTEGLSFPTRNQLHFTISVLICIQLLAPDSSLQPFSQDTPSYVSPAPVQIFMRPAQENTVGWQSCDDVGSRGHSVTRPRQEGCTQLGLTWDQLFGGQGSSRQGLGSSGWRQGKPRAARSPAHEASDRREDRDPLLCVLPCSPCHEASATEEGTTRGL